MGRQTATVVIALFFGLAACDGDGLPLGSMDAAEPDRGPSPDGDSGSDVGDPDEGVQVDRGRADADLRDDASPEDAAPTDGGMSDWRPPTDATPADSGMADMTPPMDATRADATPADAGEPDAQPDLGLPCQDDTQCDGICGADGRCRACMADDECAGERCADGACLPCRDRDDCDGRLCEADVCLDIQCRDEDDCGGLLCEAGLCLDIQCRDQGDCAGLLCEAGLCLDIQCRGRDDCDGRLCEAGVCLEIECRDRAECAAGQACSEAGICGPCAVDADCGQDLCDDGVCRACGAVDHRACGAAELCCRPPEGPDQQPSPYACAPTDPLVGCSACGVPCPEGQVCADRACLQPNGTAVLAAEADLEVLWELIGVMGEAADLSNLEGGEGAEGVVTFFAPSNEALGALSAGCRNAIIVNGQRFIDHHTFGNQREVLTAELLAETADEVPEGIPLAMESGGNVVVRRGDDGGLLLDDLPLLRSVPMANGVVHIMGGVFLVEPYTARCQPAP